MTTPIRFDSNDVTHWINVLHNAAKVQRGDADYEDAQAVIGTALLQIQHLNRAAQAADPDQIAAGQPGQQTNPGAAVIGGLAHGASLGLGEPIAGAISALRGKGFRAGAEEYREGLGNLEAAHPEASAASQVAGMVALPGPTAIRAAAQGTRAVAPGVVSGVPALVGGTLGAVSGFAGGGEDAGDLGARLKAAAIGGGTGLAAGAGLGMLAARNARNVARGERLAARKDKAVEALARERNISVPPAAVSPDDALRAQLLSGGVLPENVEAQLTRQLQMESPAFQRRASELGQPQRAVPTAEPSGVGNPPVNPAAAQRYVAETRARMTPEGRAGFPHRDAVLAALDLPENPMPALTLSRGGRFSRKGSQMATQPLSPEQQRALESLVAESLLGPNTPRPGHPIFRGTRSFTRSPEVRGEPPQPSGYGYGSSPAAPSTGAMADQQLKLLVGQDAEAVAGMIFGSTSDEALDAARQLIQHAEQRFGSR